MSEQINKVLADRPQSFDSAQQAQARDNIGAMAASASALFGISGVSSNAPITGDGTSGSPLGLSSRVTLASAGAMNDMTPLYQQFTAASLSSLHQAGYSDYEQDHYTAWIDPQKVIFKTDSGAQERVDYSSIQRWNSYSAGTPVTTNNCISGDGTTANPIGLSSHVEFSGNNVSSDLNASHFIIQGGGSTSWHQRNMFSVEATDYTATHAANKSLYQVTGSAGTQEVDARSIYSWNHPQYYCICPHITGAYSVYLSTSDYPTGLTAAARLDIVPFGDTAGCVNFVANQSAGATANLYPSANSYDTPWLRSATIWWDPEVQLWVDN